MTTQTENDVCWYWFMIIVNNINSFVNYNTNFTSISPFLLASSNSLAIALTPPTWSPSPAQYFSKRKLYFYLPCQDLVPEQLMPQILTAPLTHLAYMEMETNRRTQKSPQKSSAGWQSWWRCDSYKLSPVEDRAAHFSCDLIYTWFSQLTKLEPIEFMA